MNYLSSEEARLDQKSPRIHLLMTCLVTNIRRDGSLSAEDRAATLLECLRSLQEISFTSASVYISIGEDISLDESELEAEVSRLAKKVTFQTKRLEHFLEWQNAVSLPDLQQSDSVLLLSYEDHILRNGRAEVVIDAVRKVNRATEAFPKGNFISILSHFPEQQILSDCWSAIGFRSPASDLDAIPAPTPIGCLVTKPAVLREWFSRDFTGGQRIVAPENYFGPSVNDSSSISLVISSEAFFHKDGYGHVNLIESKAEVDSTRPLGDEGLLGRSNTWQTQVRLGTSLTFIEYAKSQFRASGMSGLGLVSRSISLKVIGAMTNFAFIQRFIWTLVTKNPTIAHYVGMGFAHGLLRYLVILTRAYFKHKVFTKVPR